jgi:hypothetical protein
MTKPLYTVLIDDLTNKETILRTDSDGKVWSIPSDPANFDYQAYLNRDNPDWGKPLL